MELQLNREDATNDRTIGSLFIDGRFEAFSLEDAIRLGPTIYGETAIPAGRYEVVITRSPRLQRMLPRLKDVPGFEGVLIHSGNTSQDTEGCILVGQSRAHDSLESSRLALAALQPKIAGAIAKGERVFITIVNPDPDQHS